MSATASHPSSSSLPVSPAVALASGLLPEDALGRIVPLEGAINFRDLGGLPAGDGRRVRSRRIYRAGLIDRLSDADVAELAARRILTVLDFREADEAAHAPDRLPGDAIAITLCSAGHDSPDAWARQLATADSGVPFMEAFYASTGSLAARYRPFFEHLLALPEDRALLFHCTVGKDRTGIGAALLLSALGVPDEAILADYLLTNTCRAALADDMNIPGLLDGVEVKPQVARDLLSARPEYLRALRDSITQRHGTFATFLETVLGVGETEVRLLREKFTEPA
ncbi:protein tyrosine phosphatase [Opitutaceae bacterium TAV5]|nr:protein tyrosine phosphatase [Opitutaceae bacterium TAV5]